MADLTQDEARELTDHIVSRVSDLLPLIKEAFEGRADRALGYTTWADYCDTELRGIRLPVESRREAIAELTDAGMSSRAIGSALGIDQSTVVRDRQRSSDANASDEPPRRVTALDGRSRPASVPRPEPTPQPTAEDEEHARQVRVATGLLTDTVVTLAQMDGTDAGQLFDPDRANRQSRPITQDTIISAIETLDALLAAFRERNLP